MGILILLWMLNVHKIKKFQCSNLPFQEVLVEYSVFHQLGLSHAPLVCRTIHPQKTNEAWSVHGSKGHDLSR